MYGPLVPATMVGPPFWLLVLVAVVLFGPPFGAMVHGTRSDGELAGTYTTAGTACFCFVAAWLYVGLSAAGSVSELLFLVAAVAVSVTAAMHVSRALGVGRQSAVRVALVYTPTALLVAVGVLWL